LSDKKCAGDACNVAFQHHDCGGFLGGIGSATEGDTEIRGGEGGSVVRAIACHCDETRNGAEKSGNAGSFAFRFDGGLEAGDAELGGDSASGFGLIASEKLNIDTEIF
jgi:hypothetical protein